jgi:hypothetical protein
MRDIGYERECDLGFVSGAFMFCRIKLLQSLHGFDPQYFFISKTSTCAAACSGVTRHPIARLFLANAAHSFGQWGWRMA